MPRDPPFAERRGTAGQPLLIALDDLQWADRTSRFMLRVLVSRLTGLPVVWLLAGRDDLGTEVAGPDLIRRHHLRLGPLTGCDLAAMAQDRLGRVLGEQVRGLLAASGGNPFLAIEILDGIVEAAARGEQGQHAPVEFTAAIARQLAELADPASELVRLVSVVGCPTSIHDAAVLLPDGSGAGQALPDAVRSGLLTASGEVVSFRHDLVRDAVYAAIPAQQARRLHLQFARYHLGVSGSPLAAAAHVRAAATHGDPDSAQMLVWAAEALAEVSAEDAGELAALAFRTVRPAQPQWLELGMRCLAVLCRTQRTAETITVADLILARIDDGDLAGQVETQAARALWLSGRVRELTSRTDRVLQLTDLAPGVTARLLAARALATTRTQTGEADRPGRSSPRCATGGTVSCLLQCFGDRGPGRARADGDDRGPSTRGILCGRHGLTPLETDRLAMVQRRPSCDTPCRLAENPQNFWRIAPARDKWYY